MGGIYIYSGDLISQMNIKEVESLSPHELANKINKTLFQPLKEYQSPCPPGSLFLEEDSLVFLEVSEGRVFKLLLKLNPSKSHGPDETPN